MASTRRLWRHHYLPTIHQQLYNIGWIMSYKSWFDYNASQINVGECWLMNQFSRFFSAKLTNPANCNIHQQSSDLEERVVGMLIGWAYVQFDYIPVSIAWCATIYIPSMQIGIKMPIPRRRYRLLGWLQLSTPHQRSTAHICINKTRILYRIGICILKWLVQLTS